MDKYLKILQAIRAGREISNNDLSYFMSYHQDIDESKYEELKAKMASEEGLKSLTDEDFDNYVDQARARLSGDDYKNQVLGLAKDAAVGKVDAKVKTGLNAMLAGTDIATSIAQINKANQQFKAAVKPSRPPVLQRDQSLQQALSQAGRANLDASAAIEPARLENLNQYKADLNVGATASAGQPGAYGAYGQIASSRRDRNNAALVPLQDQIRSRNLDRRDRLLALQLGENRDINQSQSQFYPHDLYQYNLERSAAAELGSQGRYNLRDALTGGAKTIAGGIHQMAANKYDDVYNQMSAYGHDHAQTAADAWKDLDGIHQEYQNYTDPRSSANYDPAAYRKYNLAFSS